MRWLILISLLVAPVGVAAHPLDDRAQMDSYVLIAPGQRLEYVVNFRYVDAVASMSEFHNGLDANEDGYVNAGELHRRYLQLVDELMGFSIGFRFDGRRIDMQPDFDRFEFRDMNGRGTPSDQRGIEVSGVRIHYRFVFFWEPESPMPPGAYTVEYYFSGVQTVLHTPEEQMVALDGRERPQKRITDVRYDTAMEVFPKLIFDWRVPEPPQPTDENPPTTVEPPANDSAPTPAEPPPEAPRTPQGLAAWLTFAAGLIMMLFGIGVAGRRAFVPAKDGRRIGLTGGVLFALIGAGVALAALVRLECVSL